MSSQNILNNILSHFDSLYLEDLSWLYHRSMHAYEGFGVNVDGYVLPTSHYYGIYVTMKSILTDNSNACIIFCQDGRPQKREQIMEEVGLEYKADRPERQYDFYKDTDKIKAIVCSVHNCFWAYNEDKESDDEMYALAKQAEECPDFSGPIYIHSGDNDLLQSIDDRISIIRSREKGQYKKITDYELQHEENFVKKFHGVDAAHIINYRVIVGDSSDHIPGIPRFPRDVAYNIAMNPDWKPVTDKEIKWHKIYEESQDIIDRNRKLMQLQSDYEVNLSKPVVNSEKLLTLLERLNLKSCKDWMVNNHYI